MRVELLVAKKAEMTVALMVDCLADLTVVWMVVKRAVMMAGKKVGMLGMKWAHMRVE